MEGRDNKHDGIPLLVVCGPTSSGKTKLAVDLAKRYDGEVVGADSMQVYRRMDIGTAKPTAAEMDGVPHHLIDFLEPDEAFSVAAYVALARDAVASIAGRGRLPVLAGGTGLYIHSLIDNIRFEAVEEDPEVRAGLERLYNEKGSQRLWEMLRECDPDMAEKLHPNNRGRVIRALEVYSLTGERMSRRQLEAKSEPSPYRLCMIGLRYRNRQILYERINMRVDMMLEQGLVQEARQLSDAGYSKTAMQAIGYKELDGYLRGETSLESAADSIKTQTRRYAKRQMTWLRRDPRINWLDADAHAGYGGLLAAVCDIVDNDLFNVT